MELQDKHHKMACSIAKKVSKLNKLSELYYDDFKQQVYESICMCIKNKIGIDNFNLMYTIVYHYVLKNMEYTVYTIRPPKDHNNKGKIKAPKQMTNFMVKDKEGNETAIIDIKNGYIEKNSMFHFEYMLRNLDDEYKKLMYMYYYFGLTIVKISKLLKRDRKSITNKMQKAHNIIQKEHDLPEEKISFKGVLNNEPIFPTKDKCPNLRNIIAEKGFTTKGLAMLIGVNTRTLESWKQHKYNPSDENIDKLCKILKCTVEDL